jgi:hypothetical protein
MSGTTNNGFSTGKDLQLALMGPTGLIAMPLVTSFNPEPQYEVAKSKAIDGPTRQFSLPDGHKISIKFDRKDPTLDNFFAALEAAYWVIGGFVPTFTLYAYVAERNGGTSTYEWREFTTEYKPGDWKSGSPVSGGIDGFARFFKKIG